jgi:hypothetical protein
MKRIISNIVLSSISFLLFLLFLELIFLFLHDEKEFSPNTQKWQQKYVIRNSHGFRDREYSYKKPKDIFRILVLGDSQTFGHGIKKLEDTWHKKLEVLMNKDLDTPRFEIISLANEGWNTDSQLYELFKTGFKYEPDMVLLGFYENDVPNINSSKCNGIDIKFFPNSKPVSWFRKHSHLYKNIEFRVNRLLEELGYKLNYTDCINLKFKSRAWDMEKVYLDTILQATQIKNIHFLLATLPLIYKLGNDYPLKSYHLKVKTYCEKNGIENINLYEIGFKGLEAEKLSVSRKDKHLNSKGTTIVANALFTRLKALKKYKHLSRFSGAFDLNEILDQKEIVKKTDQNFNKLKNENNYIKLNSKNENLEIKKKEENLIFLNTVFENKKSTIYKIILNKRGAFQESEIFFYKENDSNIYFSKNKFKGEENLVSRGKLINRKNIEKTNKTFLLKYSYNGQFQKLEIEKGKYFRDPKVFENKLFNSPEPTSTIEKIKLERDIFNDLSYFLNYKSYFESLQKDILNQKPSKTAIRALGKIFLVRNNFTKFKEIRANNPGIIFYEYKFEVPPS